MDTIKDTDKSQGKYKRNCPQCNSEIIYNEIRRLKASATKNGKCKKCIIKNGNDRKRGKFQRECPSCQKLITYSTKPAIDTAIKKQSLCKSCGIKKSCANPERRKIMSERFKGKNNPMYGKTGNKSPFYGRHHTQQVKEKLSKDRIGIPLPKEHRDKVIAGMCKARNVQKELGYPSSYEWWLMKYGKEEADKKMEERKKKQSIKSSGKNNPMYGKPSPKGSGVGWKGWYKGLYFRSLREVSYMLYLDSENISWKAAENIVIKYINWDGKERTYRPDFLVGNKIVEIKPLKMQETPNIKCKTAAAIEYCNQNGLIYEITDCKIETDLLSRAYNNKLIKFHGQYEEKFLNYIKQTKE